MRRVIPLMLMLAGCGQGSAPASPDGNPYQPSAAIQAELKGDNARATIRQTIISSCTSAVLSGSKLSDRAAMRLCSCKADAGMLGKTNVELAHNDYNKGEDNCDQKIGLAP